MITKGNQRGGGRQLATHLLNAHDNERVEVAEIRGAVAQDLHGAFAEWYAQSKATRAEKYLYSLSINPPRPMSREDYIEFANQVEKRLKLDQRGRAIVFHVKPDKKGVPREHAHVVWSRIDPEKGKAVQISYDRQELRSLARNFARAHDMPLPKGMEKDGDPGRFDRRQEHENLKEKQQQERSGFDKATRMREITEAWNNHPNNPTLFVQAITQKGYVLARGDSSRYVVIDRAGDVHSLYRQIKGVKAKHIKEFLAHSHPLDKLPDAEAARARVQERHPDPPAVYDRQERLDALARKQDERREPILQDYTRLGERQDNERKALAELHGAQNRTILDERAAREPKGLFGFMLRITRFEKIIAARQRKTDMSRAAEQKRETARLKGRHDRELLDAYRRLRDLRAVELRERRSLDLTLRRESLHPRSERVKDTFAGAAKPKLDPLDILKAARVLKPVFAAAASPDPKQTSAGDTKAPEKPSLSDIFKRALSLAHPLQPDPKPEDKPAAKPVPERDDRLEQAKRLMEDIRRQQRGPDKDRNR
jgi:hypothetical protein